MRVRTFLLSNARTIGSYVLCLLLFLAATVYSPGFANPAHLRQLVVFASFVGFAALGQTFVILTGGLDLSVPWLVALGGIQMSVWSGSGGVADWGKLSALLAIGAVIGLANGIGVTVFRIPPIIMTLGVGGLVEGYLQNVGLDRAQALGGSAVASTLVTGRVGPVPVLALIWVVAAVLMHRLLARSPFGRRIYGVGSNDTVARLSGINVARVRVITYCIAGASSVFTGVLLAGYIGRAYLAMGAPYLFASIAAVAVGGASILGGRGTYWGTVAGALTLTLLSAMLPLFNLTDPAIEIVYGLVILLGVYLSRLGPRLAGLVS